MLSIGNAATAESVGLLGFSGRMPDGLGKFEFVLVSVSILSAVAGGLSWENCGSNGSDGKDHTRIGIPTTPTMVADHIVLVKDADETRRKIQHANAINKIKHEDLIVTSIIKLNIGDSEKIKFIFLVSLHRQ